MDIISDFTRLENENYHSYIWRMDELIRSGKYHNWKEITPMVNNELFGDEESQYRDESAYRKSVKYARDFYEAGVFGLEDEYFKKLRLERQSLEKERTKVRDERNELRRIIREEARKESYKDQILRSISEYNCNPLEYDENKRFTGILKTDNDIVCTVFDVHTGLDVNNHFNVFNENVLKDRINQYIDKIFEVQLRHGSENINIILSELVSGLIHLALRIENNQNLIEQFLTITDYLSQFISELSYHFNTVNVYVCPGNHSRCNPNKDENMRGENMDLLAIPYLQAKLQNYRNVVFHENIIDSSIAMFNVRGQLIYAVHGDKDSMDSVVQKLTLYTSHKPDIIYMGHKHTNAMLTSYDVKVIQAGCLSGGGDEYCLDKRLKNKAEQIISVITDKGLDCIYDVKFD